MVDVPDSQGRWAFEGDPWWREGMDPLALVSLNTALVDADAPLVPDENGREVPPEYFERFADVLPSDLFYLWRRYGFGSFNDGWVWLTDPVMWQPMLNDWLSRVELPFADEWLVVLRSAFGSLTCWGPSTGQSLDIDPVNGLVAPTDESSRVARFGGRMVISTLGSQAAGLRDPELADGPAFARALSLAGPLTEDTVYGYVPMLALGGDPATSQIEVMNARVHLSLLAQTTPVHVMQDMGALLDHAMAWVEDDRRGGSV